MIDNRLRKCCEGCYNINLKCGTGEITARNVLGDYERNTYSFIACEHERVCKKYIECDQEQNGQLVLYDASGNRLGTWEELLADQFWKSYRTDFVNCGKTEE